MSPKTPEFIDLFFEELDRREIPYVIIHSYQNLPHDVRSDIDYAVYDRDLQKLTEIQEELGHSHGWAVLQSLQHGACAFYNVLASLADPRQILQLDACSNYTRARRLLVSDRVLLDNRRRFGKYWIPDPAAEFAYEVTKLFDAKQKDPAVYIPRLKALWEQDKDAAQSHFERAFGSGSKSLEQWFDSPPGQWLSLRDSMLARNKFEPLLLCRESIRVLKRLLRPAGVQITLLGSDGSGKTTLITKMRAETNDFFRRFNVYHFRPKYFESKGEGTAVTDPHAEPVYGVMRSMAKLLYYFFDYWTGFVLKIYRQRVETTLVVFDRDFDDLLVDPRRYRIAPAALGLARLLRRFLPKSEMIFILDVDPAACHARKPELPVAELERQRAALRSLAEKSDRYVLVCADTPPTEVARKVSDGILGILLKRRGLPGRTGIE
jgi:thymidylate kinase